MRYFTLTALLLLVKISSFELGSYETYEWPPANYAIEWKTECKESDVLVYAYQFGWDQHVVTLSPGESHSMMSSLGHQYFAVSPDHRFLGNFTTHWDPEKQPAVTQGSSRRFVITCNPSCLTEDQETNTCANDPNKEGFRSPRSYSEDTSTPEAQLYVAQRKHEKTRIQLSKKASSIKRFTEVGFKTGLKLSEISPEGWEQTLAFYQQARDTSLEVLEAWDKTNTYVNHLEVPVTVMHLPYSVKEIIWRDLAIALGEWTGLDPKDLVGSSIYGIRRYWRGALLRNHADRVELVLSAIINVDIGKMEEPWPLQIYDHDGNPHIVMMQPGDVVLYESAACIHGRPLPMNGEYMANVFAHTKPVDWLLTEKEHTKNLDS